MRCMPCGALEVVQDRAVDAQQARRHGEVVGAVAHRLAEAAPAPEAHERPRAPHEPEALAAQGRAAVAADDGVRDAEALEQAERLGEVARRDVHSTPASSSRRRMGRKKRTCGELVRSIQTFAGPAGTVS